MKRNVTTLLLLIVVLVSVASSFRGEPIEDWKLLHKIWDPRAQELLWIPALDQKGLCLCAKCDELGAQWGSLRGSLDDRVVRIDFVCRRSCPTLDYYTQGNPVYETLYVSLNGKVPIPAQVVTQEHRDGTVHYTIGLHGLSTIEAEELIGLINENGPDYRRFGGQYYLQADGTLGVCDFDPRLGTHHHRDSKG